MNSLLYCLAGLLLLILAFAAYLGWQSAIRPAPYETMFAVRPSEAVRVTRERAGWAIHPSAGARPVRIRYGTSPAALEPGVSLVAEHDRLFAPAELDPHRRYYFEVDLQDGRTLKTAERFLPLHGVVNFRDLGGYETLAGRRVAWGKLYRSGDLSRLTEDDWAILQNLGVRLFCDLRGDREVKANPDRLPAGAVYRRLPVFERDPIGRRHALLLRHRLDPLFQRFYRESIITAGAPALGSLLRLAADPDNLPLVIHCTSGKDRTGIASALLLHVCGVPRETIIADYSLTNLSIEKFLSVMRQAFRAVRPPPGIRLEQFYPLFSARPELIEHAFHYIETRYGSVERYLTGPAGLAEAELDALRQNLLD